jgi:hypothetical protein
MRVTINVAALLLAVLLCAAGWIIGGEKTARAQKSDPCKIFLEKAKRKVQRSRDNVWIGVDGLRMSAVEDITDYLTCEADQK